MGFIRNSIQVWKKLNGPSKWLFVAFVVSVLGFFITLASPVLFFWGWKVFLIGFSLGLFLMLLSVAAWFVAAIVKNKQIEEQGYWD